MTTPLRRKTILLLLVVLMGHFLLHLEHSPIWITAVVLLLTGWRTLNEYGYVVLPSRFIANTIGLGLFVVFYLVNKTFLGLDAGVQLLVLICLLYTSPSPRDRTRSRMPSSA